MKTATVQKPKSKGFTLIVKVTPIRMPFISAGRKRCMDDKNRPNRAAQKRAAFKD